MIRELYGKLFPRRAAKRLLDERTYNEAKRLYEAATADQFHPVRSNTTSGDGALNHSGDRLRQLSRHLEENHDIVVSVFDDLVNNTVGTGAAIQPMVRLRSGELAVDTNKQIAELWDEWADSPEVSGEWGFESVERHVARHLFRDGEIFVQLINDARFAYQTRVPLVLELIEADFVPFDFFDDTRNILHGVELNEWKAPAAYWMLLQHPDDPMASFSGSSFTQAKKRVDARMVIHPKFSRRANQRRGLPILHSVINRLRDMKDYTESERIAARVASDMTGYIKRTSEYQGAVDVNSAKNRDLAMSSGAIFELLPGEDVGTIQSNRPNSSAFAEFMGSMMRAVAGGVGSRYSSIARDYNGSYSSQRQELAEGAIHYRSHFGYLARRFYRPVYDAFIERATLTGLIRPEAGFDPLTIRRVDFRAPALPWIDPQKEAKAFQTLVDANLESRAEIMRMRGRDPAKVMEEMEREQASDVFASQLELLPSPPAEDAEPEDDASEAAA